MNLQLNRIYSSIISVNITEQLLIQKWGKHKVSKF